MLLAPEAASINTLLMVKLLLAVPTKAPVLVPPDRVVALKRTSRTTEPLAVFWNKPTLLVPDKLKPVMLWPKPANVPAYATLLVPSARILAYLVPLAAPLLVNVEASISPAKAKLVLFVPHCAVVEQ